MVNIEIKRLGVENWTPEDFEREAEWRKACVAVTEQRQAKLIYLGWKITVGRLYHKGKCCHGKWAKSPQGEVFSFTEACLTVGSMPTYPSKPEAPSSSEGMFHLELVKIQPMEIPSGSIFYVSMLDTPP